MNQPEVFERPQNVAGRWGNDWRRERYFNAGRLGDTVACVLIDRWQPAYVAELNVTTWVALPRIIRTCGGIPLQRIGKGKLQMPDGRTLDVLDWPEL